VSIGRNTLMRLLVLLFRLLELDLVDLDTHLGIAEAGVEGEFVGLVPRRDLWGL